MKQPNNRAIALLLALNIIMSIIILVNINDDGKSKDSNVAYAQTIDNVELTRKNNDESEVDVKEEEDIIFNVEKVTSADSKKNTIPLFFSHINDEGGFFTYLATDEPKNWTQGYWFIDYSTLANANINPMELKHNDEIQGVFYPSVDEYGDYFEIKEVVATDISYTYK